MMVSLVSDCYINLVILSNKWCIYISGEDYTDNGELVVWHLFSFHWFWKDDPIIIFYCWKVALNTINLNHLLLLL